MGQPRDPRDPPGGRPEGPPADETPNPFWWLERRHALLRRFVLAQALSPPRSRQPWGRRAGRPGPRPQPRRGADPSDPGDR